jgi:Acetyltransferases, including N-acetylases of ribosomal proteins
MSLKLRSTNENDLRFVTEIESEAAGERFVTAETLEAHAKYLADADIRHLIIENDGKSVGYAIMAGIGDANESLELRRLVIAEKGKGYGREALRAIKRMAFEELGAHRLWLDVKDFNRRARSLYESEGFTTEGVWRECVKTDDGRESLVFMSILRSEYEK